MLDKFPREVFWMILDRVPEKRDLNQLCVVSKALCDLTLPKLYQTITINPRSEVYLEGLNVKRFVRGVSSRGRRYVRNLEICAPFEKNLVDRCVHIRDKFDHDERDFGETWNSREAGGRTKFQRLAKRAVGLLERLEDESLKSFSWNLGTCIPRQILGPDGYLPLKQTSLEAINLITGNGCRLEGSLPSEIDLLQFKALRRISWIGVRSDASLKALRGALVANSARLTHLGLEYVKQTDGAPIGGVGGYEYDDEINEEGVAEGIDYGNHLAREILGLKRSIAEAQCVFASLSSLSLAFVPLKNAEKPLAHAFNIGQLTRLSLRKCSGMEYFLKEIINTGQAPPKLTSLEFTADFSDTSTLFNSLKDVFRIVANLTDLFLSVPGPDDTRDLWRSIAESNPPLKRLVFHQRHLIRYGGFEKRKDLTDLSLFEEEIEELEIAGEGHPFAQLNLLCLGLSCLAPTVERILAPPETTKSLKILHIRVSGSEFFLDRNRWNIHNDLNAGSDSGGDDSGSDHEDMGTEPNTEYQSLPHMPPSSPGIQNPEVLADILTTVEYNSVPVQVLRLAMWAFGSDGAIPSLQVLACGDFSYEGRFKSCNTILCRQPWTDQRPGNARRAGVKPMSLPFRPIRKSDRRMWELINENMDFLSACPEESLFFAAENEVETPL